MWMMAEDDLNWKESFSLAETLLDDFLLTYPVFMSTSDLCQALLGQYPYRNTEIVFNLSLSSGSSDHHQHWFHSCSISIITCAACWGLNPWLHLLYQALQGEGGWEGGPGEETQGPVPGVAMDGAVQRLPAWRRARQALHEGKRRGVAPKKSESERVKTDVSFQNLCSYVLDDLFEHPALEKDVRELQKVYMLHRRQWVTVQRCRFVHVGRPTQSRTRRSVIRREDLLIWDREVRAWPLKV